VIEGMLGRWFDGTSTSIHNGSIIITVVNVVDETVICFWRDGLSDGLNEGLEESELVSGVD
jgi:uncharacterized protein YodC (DUF2158 family)